MSKKILEQLGSVVGESGLLTGEALLNRNADWMRSAPNKAVGLVRPKSTEEVSRIMEICSRHGQRVVVHGGLTGLVDATTPGPGELVLSLERMKQIESLDTVGRTATVQAGVTLQSLQEAAEKRDLLFASDWGARGTTMIGGAIATNGGGSNVLRYGMIREQVLGLEVVLGTGETVTSMNEMLKNNTGYDLKQLFIGTEGTLGIVTRAVLRLRPRPRSQNTALVAVKNVSCASELLTLVDAELGGSLSAFEMMSRDFFELITSAGEHSGALSSQYPMYILLEARGGDPSVDEARFQSALEKALKKDLLLDAAICTSGPQRDAQWAIREDIPVLASELRPMIIFDVSLPIRYMDEYLETVYRDVEDKFPGARGVSFGHIGDCNLHLCWCVGSDGDDIRTEMSRIVYDALVPYNGSISAEHGIGREKKDYLELSKSAAEIEWMRRIKRLMDPAGILNMGRVF